MCVRDDSTGATLTTDSQLSTTGVAPRCIVYRNSLPLITFFEGVLLQCVSVDSSGDFTRLSMLVTDASIVQAYDVNAVNRDLVVAYSNNTFGLTVSAFVAPFTGPRWSTTVSSGQQNVVSCFADPQGNTWVAAGDSSVVTLYRFRGATGALDFSTSLALPRNSHTNNVWTRITGVVANNSIYVFAEESSTSTSDACVRMATLSWNGVSVGTPTCSTFILGHGLASRPFVDDGEVSVIVVADSNDQSNYFCVDADRHCSARFLGGDANGVRSTATLPNVNFTSLGCSVATEREGNIEIDVTNGKYTIGRRVGMNETLLDFNASPTSVSLANNLLTAGARGFIYDGNAVYEQGFDQSPTVVSSSLVGFPVMTGGTYQYAFTYEWTDGQGQVQSSGPSALLNVNNPSGVAAQFVVRNLRTTLKQSVRIVGYRSAVDPDASSGTIILQRFTSIDNPTVNSITTDWSTITDTTPNADVLVAPALYSSTGELADTPIPPCTIVEVFKQRVFCAGLEDPSQLAYSKLANRDGVAVEFSNKLTLPTNAGGDLASGPVTALKAMDDKLIIFKRSSISIIAGDGPDNTGGGSDYGLPQLVSSDVGCTDPRSLVLIPEGVMFDSSDGIYLLDRSMQVSYIGAPVESTNGQRIVGATLTPNTNQARFACSDGPTLVFDYIAKQWSHFTYPTLEGSTVWNDAYVITDTGGRVYVEDPSSFTDAGAPIKLKLRTGWIAGSGILGFSRIRNLWLLGKYVGPHQLVASVEYDGQEGSGYTTTFDSTSIINATAYGTGPYGVGAYGGSPLPYQLGWTLPRQKCRSLRITIEDSQSSGFNQGVQLKAMAIEISAYPGLNRLPSQATK